MNYKQNPVIQETIVKEIINKERKVREKWMMDHGVKYYKYPFEYANFYGSGLSTPTPGPKLTRFCPISLHCGGCNPCNYMDVNTNHQEHVKNMLNYPYKNHHSVHRDLDYVNREKTSNGHIYLPHCANSPEFRFGVCSNCFYQYCFQ